MRETLLNPATSEYYQLDNHYQLDNTCSILELEPNFKTLDIETVELVNDSEYLNRIEMLWGDWVEWL